MLGERSSIHYAICLHVYTRGTIQGVDNTRPMNEPSSSQKSRVETLKRGKPREIVGQSRNTTLPTTSPWNIHE